MRRGRISENGRVDIDGVVERVTATLDVNAASYTALAALVREVVAQEEAWLRARQDDGSLIGAMKARELARGHAALAQQGRGAIEAWSASLTELMRTLGEAVVVPARNGEEVVRVTVPIIRLVDYPAKLIGRVVAMALGWSSEPGDIRLGGRLAQRVKENLLAASGLSEEEARKHPRRLVWPEAVKDATATELVEKYLGGTALARFLLSMVEWVIDDKDLIEGCHIMARVGHGKSQGLLWLVTLLLRRRDPPSLVIVDSQGFGELLEFIARLKVFAPGERLQDRLIMISPSELERPAAVNLFARPHRLATYSPAMREQIANKTIELLEYLFGAVLGAELTQKQQVIFRPLVRLLMAIPGANLLTLRDVLRHPDRYAEAIWQLDGSARDFFENDFFSPHYRETRLEVMRRLHGVTEQPTFERMFSARTNKLDMFERLQTGCVLLADTSKEHLGSDRSAILGRLIIAMTLRGIYERAALPIEVRRPTYLILDEGHEYLEDNKKMLELISQGRRYRCGAWIAHQFWDQLPGTMRAGLAGQTGVRLVGEVSDGDARDLAPDLRTTPDFLLSMRKGARSSEFALHVRNKTRTAVRLPVPFGAIDSEPRMTDEQWELVKERNRQRYGEAPAEVPEAAPKPGPAAIEDESDWRS